MRIEPLTIGCSNSVQMLGLSWAAARRLARELGIRELRVSERKVLLPARELLEALLARTESAPASASDEEQAAADEVLQLLGLERVPGSAARGAAE